MASTEHTRPRTGRFREGVLERNVRALVAHREEFERNRNAQERVIGAITNFAGSVTSVYLHIVVYGFWIALDAGWLPWEPADPTFVSVALAASVEALLLSTFILITQNRMSVLADRRADLHLQIGLLAEREVTRLLELVTEIAKRMNIEASNDAELDELTKTVEPAAVLDTLEQTEREHSTTTH